MKPRVLMMTCTRDGYANPSRRLPDKHIRLFHGKTLDEWFCIRAWSSKYMTDFAVIGETEKHCERIRPMVESYGGEVYCRPPAYLHPKEDTGGQPLRWVQREMVKRHGPYNAVISNFVVNPVIPPGLWDDAVEKFMEALMDPELYKSIPVLEPLYHPQESFKEQRADGLTYWVGSTLLNTSKTLIRWAGVGGWNVTTEDYNEMAWALTQSGMVTAFNTGWGTVPYEVPRWTDVHIDTPEEWDLAEWYFGKYIGMGDEAYDGYAAYRKLWKEQTC
jgi:hypothetical protein